MTSPEAPIREELPQETVERFVNFTRNPLIDEDSRQYTDWQHEMDRLYGNPELAHLSRDRSLEGVTGIRETLEATYEREGLEGLKVEFLRQTIAHTRLGSLHTRIIEVILNFQ